MLAEAWDLYRRFAGHFLLISFAIYVVTAILVALLSLGGIAGALIGAVMLGFILILLPLWLRSFVNSVLSGTLIAPFLALVATLIYYRLTAAHAGQPYTPTGPAGAPVWQPPHPTTAPGPAGYPGPPPADPAAPGPAGWGPVAPGPARPYPPPGSAQPGPAEPPPTTPPDRGPDAPPPPSTP